LFSGGGGAENEAMVTSRRPQALFRLRQHPSGTAVEILGVLEAGPNKLVRKAGYPGTQISVWSAGKAPPDVVIASENIPSLRPRAKTKPTKRLI
jgi:hypothetical protein